MSDRPAQRWSWIDAAVPLGMTASVNRFCVESYCTVPTVPLVALAIGAYRSAWIKQVHTSDDVITADELPSFK